MAKDTELKGLTQFMRYALGIGTIAVGADKFTNLLCDWEKYLSPRAEELLPMSGDTFMKLVGVIEMGVGAGILARKSTAWSSYLAGAWLLGIAGNLVSHTENYNDIAARDFHMAIEAFALGTLARHYLKEGERSGEGYVLDSDSVEIEQAA